MDDGRNVNPMDDAAIPNQPPGYCVICDGELGVGNGYYRHVYAGTNPDGSGRMAHKICWQNMSHQLWLSYGVSLDELSEKEFAARQAAKPKLGKPPIGLGEWIDARTLGERIKGIDDAVTIQQESAL